MDGRENLEIQEDTMGEFAFLKIKARARPGLHPQLSLLQT